MEKGCKNFKFRGHTQTLHGAHDWSSSYGVSVILVYTCLQVAHTWSLQGQRKPEIALGCWSNSLLFFLFLTFQCILWIQNQNKKWRDDDKLSVPPLHLWSWRGRSAAPGSQQTEPCRRPGSAPEPDLGLPTEMHTAPSPGGTYTPAWLRPPGHPLPLPPPPLPVHCSPHLLSRFRRCCSPLRFGPLPPCVRWGAPAVGWARAPQCHPAPNPGLGR